MLLTSVNSEVVILKSILLHLPGVQVSNPQEAADAASQAKPRRRLLRRPERREQILAAATRAFAHAGFAATSLDDVAAGLGAAGLSARTHSGDRGRHRLAGRQTADQATAAGRIGVALGLSWRPHNRPAEKGRRCPPNAAERSLPRPAARAWAGIPATRHPGRPPANRRALRPARRSNLDGLRRQDAVRTEAWRGPCAATGPSEPDLGCFN